MEYRLLIELDALEVLYSLPKATRLTLLARLRELRLSPDRYSDYVEHDFVGWLLDVSLIAGHAISYWIDFSDRHVKVLKIASSDR